MPESPTPHAESSEPHDAGATRELDRRILALAWPNVLSNLSVPLLSAVDLALMGRLDQLRHLGGVALGAAAFDLLYWAFGFLRMGTTGLVAQARGAGDDAEQAAVLARGLFVAALGAAAMLLARAPLEQLAALMMRANDASPAVEAAALAYFRVRIWAAPATLALYVCHGYWIGRGEVRTALALTVVVNVANVIGSLAFVAGLDLGAVGVAWGTLVAQWLGLLVALAVLRRRAAWRHLGRWLEPTATLRFLGVGRDIMIRTLLLVGAFAFFRLQSAAQGEVALAANVILLQLVSLAAYGIDGFAFAAETLVGEARGGRDRAGLRAVVGRSMRWGVALGLLAGVTAYAAAPWLIALFTDHAEVARAARPYLLWAVVGMPIGAVCFIWDGVYIGATATAAMRDAMIACCLGVFVPLWWLTQPLGNHGLWLALTVFMAARGVALGWLAPRSVYALDLE